jgi:hypothetical protein
MDLNPSDNNNDIGNNQQNDSPITKMKIMTAEKAKKESQYWIDHFKFKQNLLNQLELLKNEKPEKMAKISQIATFSKEQELLCDNLYKMNIITNYSQIKLGNNYNKMKVIENNEEIQKKKMKDIFDKNLDKIRIIEKTSEEIAIQREIFKNFNEFMEKLKNNISTIRKENCLNIDNLCNKYSQNNKEFKKLSKLYNLFNNILKYRVLDVQNDENDPQTKKVRGYLLNAQNGNILSYNMDIKNNESVESKAMKVFNFWKTLVDFNKNTKGDILNAKSS